MTDPLEDRVMAKVVGRGALRRDWHLMSRVYPYLRPYWKKAAVSVLLTIMLAVIALAEPWPLAFIVDSVIGDKGAPGWVTAIFGSGTGALIALAVGATLILTLLSGGLTVINEYLSTTIDQRMVLDLRSEMFQHAQKLSLRFHDTERKGVLMYRINQQGANMGQIVTALPTLAQSALTIIGMGYIAFRINHLLALLALGTTPFIAYSTTYYADRIQPRLYRVRGLGAINMAIVYESMAMMRVILAFGRERREYKRFRTQGEMWVDETIGLTVRQTAFKLAVSLITSAGTAAVLGVGAYQAVHGEITAGQLIVVLTYIAQVYQPLEELTTTLTQFQQWFIGIRMSFDLLDKEPEIKEKPDARAIGRARGDIGVRDLCFGYGGGPDVLKNISFRVPAGGAIALVGPTGAGKSTLASLLPRFYDPQKGSVTIDEVDVRDLTLESVRRQFSIVLQEPLLFSGTILDNIRYGDLDASPEQVEDAARAANAHDFISRLPDGYETRLGEGGTKISGGERQRISVARAFLRDAPILILDEPTSEIDSQTEAVILEALDRLMDGRTTVMIAHRLSTLRGVDEILVLDQGELVQRGRHDELIADPGLYRKLWEAQSRPQQTRRLTREAARQTAAAERAAIALIGDGGGDRSIGSDRASSDSEIVPVSRPITAVGRGAPGIEGRPKIVLLGMLTKIPFGGVAWLVGQYAAGFEQLGYEVYYVEAHARTPHMFTKHDGDEGAEAAAAYIAEVTADFGIGDRWAFHALHGSGRCLGMSVQELNRLYRDAALIINMHGGTLPLPEHLAADRLVFLGTDPVELEVKIHNQVREAIDFLDKHAAFFTWGLNYGNPDCKVPWASPYPFRPSPPPVVLDFWANNTDPDGAPFTTIGSWRQFKRPVKLKGRTLRWSKHQQFQKILDLPQRVSSQIELALAGYDEDDRRLLSEHGWDVRPGLELSRDLDGYREYIVQSAGELSAAKEQNVELRSGWFSERSAMYLAAGRPVVLQDTGFGNALPTGEGLFPFGDVEGAAEAIASIEDDPARHRQAARDIAREYLSHEVVLGEMLDHLGLRRHRRSRPTRTSPTSGRIPRWAPLTVTSRRPLILNQKTVRAIRRRPIPAIRPDPGRPAASVVVPVRDNLVCTRLALESLLVNTSEPRYEVVIIDDGSAAETRQYLEVISARNRHVSLLRSDTSRGFARACNRGLKAATADILVLLNNDTVVPPSWLSGLCALVKDPDIGLAGPTTNRCGGPAQITTSYETYGQMLAFARERSGGDRGTIVELPVVEMFCAAMRRDVFESVGPLDERFEVGMFEDDDYSRRVREAGFRVVCAENLFVHHFGEASLGTLAADGSYGEIFHANRRRFEEKWGVTWKPHGRRHDPEYAALARRIEAAVCRHVPEGSILLVASRGDEGLVGFDGREAWHFPRLDNGAYAGHHPPGDDAAIAHLERLRTNGAEYLVLPATSLWWLDHYQTFRRHLERYPRVSDDLETAVIYRLTTPVDRAAGRVGAKP